MRVTNSTIFERITTQLNLQQTRLAQTQEKITTGRNFLRPSDAPDQVAALDRLESQVRQTQRFVDNIGDINGKLGLQELAINAINGDLTRAKELLVQGANGTLGDENRKAIAIELETIYNNMVSVGNWKDAYGSYLFSGSEQNQPPFNLTQDPLTTPFSVFYAGNDHVQTVAIDNGFNMEIGLPGSRLFAGFEGADGNPSNVFSTLKRAMNALNTNDQAGVSQALDEVDGALTQVNIQLNRVGARQGSLQTQLDFLNNRADSLEQIISQIEDLDYVSAVTEMKNQSLALQAGQQSFAMISNLSLFNYIK